MNGKKSKERFEGEASIATEINTVVGRLSVKRFHQQKLGDDVVWLLRVTSRKDLNFIVDCIAKSTIYNTDMSKL